MIALAAAGFAAAGLCAVYRVVRGPSLADRVIGVEVALVSLAGGIVIDATNRNSHTLLAIITVIALVGLAGTFAASRFLERDASGANDRTTP